MVEQMNNDGKSGSLESLFFGFKMGETGFV